MRKCVCVWGRGWGAQQKAVAEAKDGKAKAKSRAGEKWAKASRWQICGELAKHIRHKDGRAQLAGDAGTPHMPLPLPLP